MNLPYYLFDSSGEAERAIRSLGLTGFDLKKLSLLGQGYHAPAKLHTFFVARDRITVSGRTDAFWHRVRGLVIAPAYFFLPGAGLVAMIGPVVAALRGALDGARQAGHASVLGATLAGIGVPAALAATYEAALKADKFILMLHGNAIETAHASQVLDDSQRKAA